MYPPLRESKDSAHIILRLVALIIGLVVLLVGLVVVLIVLVVVLVVVLIVVFHNWCTPFIILELH